MNLNKQQQQAVEHKKGPLLIVAGAGTGKTTVITRRIAYLINNKLAGHQNILGLTFTDKAAQEMEERLDKLLDYGVFDLWVSTFHSFCQRILQDYALEIGLSPDFKLLDRTGAWLLVRENLDKFDLDYYKPLGNPTQFIHALLEHFSRCKDEGIYPSDYLQYADSVKKHFDEQLNKVQEVAYAYSAYQQLLLDNNFLDFGDLLGYTLQLLQKRPAILSKLQEQFKYILVDEFQDTNWIQYELVKLLAKPENNLTVSADDDQALYQWRGASFNNVLQFRKDYPGVKEIVITQNFRSAQNILDLSYKLIQFNNPNRLEYQINKDKELLSKVKNKGLDLSGFKKISKKLVNLKSKNGIIEHMHFDTFEHEAIGVARKIKSIMRADKNSNFSDFAILVRANRYAEPFLRVFELEKIPYYFFASKGLYNKAIILDVISYLKVCNNYYENSAFYRLLNFPVWRISQEDISKITTYSHYKGISIYEALQQLFLIKVSPSSAEKINYMLSLIKKHSEIGQKKSVGEVFIAFLRDSGYLRYLTKSNSAEARQDLNFLNQFFNRIKKFQESIIGASINDFLREIDMEIEAGESGSLEFDPNQGPEMVRVMTLHSAKGLEFKYVFLVNMVEQRFPSAMRAKGIEIPDELVKEVAPTGDAHLQEERRLCYVGITRAKKGIFFTSADNYGGKRKKKLSRFLHELGFNNVVKTESLSSKAVLRKPKIEHKLHFNAIPSYFSFTQLMAFNACPLQYKFRHILKIPVKGNWRLSFGKTIHNTLYYALKDLVEGGHSRQGSLLSLPGQKTKLNIDELLDIYKKQWIDEWYQNKDEKNKYYKLGKRILKKFCKNFNLEQPKILYINSTPILEQNFKIKMPGIDNATFIGKIDRVDELPNNMYEIIDYKTGKTSDRLTPDHKEQLIIYQIGVEQVLNIKRPKLSILFLRDYKKYSFIASPDDKQKAYDKIIKSIKQIRKGNFEPTPGWQCQHCDFREICQYRSNNS